MIPKFVYDLVCRPAGSGKLLSRDITSEKRVVEKIKASSHIFYSIIVVLVRIQLCAICRSGTLLFVRLVRFVLLVILHVSYFGKSSNLFWRCSQCHSCIFLVRHVFELR